MVRRKNNLTDWLVVFRADREPDPPRAICGKGLAGCFLVLLLAWGGVGVAAEPPLRAMPPSVPLGERPARPAAGAPLAGAGGSDEGPIGDVLPGAGTMAYPDGLSGGPWVWQFLPEGLLYRSYLAGGREPRFAVHLFHERDAGWLGDVTLGARVGLVRYGSRDPEWPEGWQFDVEAAAFPRVTLDEERDLVSADFRYGFPLTYRRGPWEAKLAHYHLSSHLADEFLETHPTATRINYSRDAIVLGLAVRPHRDLRFYGEAGWAFYTDGGSRPWEFQFGVDYSPASPTGVLGAPFFAVNGRIRQEVDFGGNVTAQTGLQWRARAGRLMRAGFHYFQGKSDQYQFFRQHEEQIGFGLWYDY